MKRTVLLAAGILAASLHASGGRATDSASTIEVSARSFMFSPATLTVKAGSTVRWVNLDEEPHTVLDDGGLFRSAALDTKDSFSFRFEKPGTYHYRCTIHPWMVGSIVVE